MPQPLQFEKRLDWLHCVESVRMKNARAGWMVGAVLQISGLLFTWISVIADLEFGNSAKEDGFPGESRAMKLFASLVSFALCMSATIIAGAQELGTSFDLPAEEFSLSMPPSQLPDGEQPIGEEQALPSPEMKTPIIVTWKSDSFRYNRLLLEEPRLERQAEGRYPPMQLTESSFKFFTRATILPVNLLLGRHRQLQP